MPTNDAPQFSIAFLLDLQRKAGNRATARLLGRMRARATTALVVQGDVSLTRPSLSAADPAGAGATESIALQPSGTVALARPGLLRRVASRLRRLFSFHRGQEGGRAPSLGRRGD